MPTGYIQEADLQRIERVYVMDGELDRDQLGWGWDPGQTAPIPWGAVDRVVRSEVLADVHHVLSRASSG